MPLQEQAKRSIVKAVSYRALIIVSDSIIIYSLTHRLDLVVGTIILSNLASTILYYLHERFWAKIQWGFAAVKRPGRILGARKQ